MSSNNVPMSINMSFTDGDDDDMLIDLLRRVDAIPNMWRLWDENSPIVRDSAMGSPRLIFMIRDNLGNPTSAACVKEETVMSEFAKEAMQKGYIKPSENPFEVRIDPEKFPDVAIERVIMTIGWNRPSIADWEAGGEGDGPAST